eukprot:TRINITY_DN33764_c0_g1_i3.p1 TRINITY_DN33764_c0_g1~~TRINITY_DN33764_c0_g1_i3.p1  ORF type:complete len:207 (-),score=44.27 TRINITY_DN33764_c0_g1_i3:286-906(-)
MAPRKESDAAEQRNFDMRGGLLWEQRIDKEQKALLLMDRHAADFQLQQQRQRRAHRVDPRIDELEARLLGKSPSSPAALMYSSGAMPNNLRALQRMGVQDSSLMSLRPPPAKDGVVPKMRMRQVVHDADFGARKVVEYVPEFYCEPASDGKKVPVWELPAAGRTATVPVHPVDQRKARLAAEAAAAAGQAGYGASVCLDVEGCHRG